MKKYLLEGNKMPHSIERPVFAFTALLCALVCLAFAVATVTESAQASSVPPPGHASVVVNDCASATRVAAFGERRVKKIRKRWRNGQVSTAKYKNALRIWKSELREKNRLCGGGGGPPLALTESEVQARVVQRAASECNIDGNCVNYGYYTDGGHLLCSSRTTYEWGCFGYNDESNGSTCDFREIVDRSGYNGTTSRRDLSFGGGQGLPGWDCHF